MYRIIKIGMDIHSTNYTLYAMRPVSRSEDTYDIECGYGAGCLGYSLYNQLTGSGVKCVILAPTKMLTQQGQRIKTDARNAHMIAHLKWTKKLNLSALSLVVETGDVNRFAKGIVHVAYLGLASREHSSAEKINRLGITKAGNKFLLKIPLDKRHYITERME